MRAAMKKTACDARARWVELLFFRPAERKAPALRLSWRHRDTVE